MMEKEGRRNAGIVNPPTPLFIHTHIHRYAPPADGSVCVCVCLGVWACVCVCVACQAELIDCEFNGMKSVTRERRKRRKKGREIHHHQRDRIWFWVKVTCQTSPRPARPRVCGSVDRWIGVIDKEQEGGRPGMGWGRYGMGRREQ
ncbi:hypothetical protein BC832DRAFT_318748 [Gaertneriomyces semiglobifer]|nr:hypothetical protein BC832DRAFT_318748 [Gaertneriomyces semiglobifer]